MFAVQSNDDKSAINSRFVGLVLTFTTESESEAQEFADDLNEIFDESRYFVVKK